MKRPRNKEPTTYRRSTHPKHEGNEQIYVKPVPELLANVRALAGLTIMGDGRPVFLLDPNQLA